MSSTMRPTEKRSRMRSARGGPVRRAAQGRRAARSARRETGDVTDRQQRARLAVVDDRRRPPASVATTGTPAASASIATTGVPSFAETSRKRRTRRTRRRHLAVTEECTRSATSSDATSSRPPRGPHRHRSARAPRMDLRDDANQVEGALDRGQTADPADHEASGPAPISSRARSRAPGVIAVRASRSKP